MMAQAGAILPKRGINPTKNPFAPSFRYIRFDILSILVSCNLGSVVKSDICRLVLTTSNGCVIAAAMRPAKAPDRKEIENGMKPPTDAQ